MGGRKGVAERGKRRGGREGRGRKGELLAALQGLGFKVSGLGREGEHLGALEEGTFLLTDPTLFCTQPWRLRERV
jgi:hypothetical protein